MGKKIICYIQAFDCEHTIETAIQSVLNQTYDDWLCFVLSNGNQNTVKAPNWTFDVIKSAAARDSRFVVMNKRDNDVWMYMPMIYHLSACFPDSYVCSLDADDEYQSDFFERGMELAQARDLDIVACGTEIVLKEDGEAEDGILLSKREMKENLMIEEKDFTNQFSIYKPFFNEMWGKLYRAELFGQGYNWSYAKHHFFNRFLPDTLFTIDALSRSKSIEILSGTSHRFYQYKRRQAGNATNKVNTHAANKQVRRFLNGKNCFSVYDTHETVMEFLRSHGSIDESLYEYMQAVLLGWFWDFYSRTLLPTQGEKNFAELTSRLIFHPKFDEVMLYQDSGKYNNLKNYDKRLEFCKLLQNTIICQKAIRNHVYCTPATRKKLDRIAEKLTDTIHNLAGMRRRGE